MVSGADGPVSTGIPQAGVIRRRLASVPPVVDDGAPGADRGWCLALARAALDLLDLPLQMRAMRMRRMSLPELLDLPAECALLAVLEGPGEGLGLLVVSAPVLAGLVEMQTMGRLFPAVPPLRKPTLTDAAMVAPLLDAALAGLETALAGQADLVWAGGFRYASFLDDPRPLGLLLEETDYRVLQAEVAMGEDGHRQGQVLLALPARGRGALPPDLALPPADAGEPAFRQALCRQVESVPCRIEAVLTRLSMPLAHVMGLQQGEVLLLPAAALDRIVLEGIDAGRLADGRLGQNRGMRAVRLIPAAPAGGGTGQAVGTGMAPATRPFAAAGPAESASTGATPGQTALRATG